MRNHRGFFYCHLEKKIDLIHIFINMKDQDFLDEIYYFSEDETNQKIKDIYEYIKSKDNFLEILNSGSLSSLQIEEDDQDYTFESFIKTLFNVFSYDIVMSSLYRSTPNYCKRDDKLRNTYYFCRKYLIEKIMRDKKYEMLVLVKIWDNRNGSSFEILEVNKSPESLEFLIGKITDINDSVVLLLEEKYIESWIDINNNMLTFFNPDDHYLYSIVKL